MQDLLKFMDEFIRNDFVRFHNEDAAMDESDALPAIAGINMNRQDRVDRLHRWLNYYGVLRFKGSGNKKAAEAILNFAAALPCGTPLTRQKLMDEYARLESMVKQCVPENKSGEARSITSLTSKALWCCYPHDVPIYDRNARCALQVLCRLLHINIDVPEENYEAFADAWFQVYEHLKPVIDSADIAPYLYKVRVLDSFLWYLGDPKFDKREAES